MNKRTFLKSIGLLGLASVPKLYGLEDWIGQFAGVPPETLASDEDFWEGIRGGYRLKPDYINLENGYYCFLPESLLEKFIAHVREVNYQGSYYMRTVQFDNKRRVAEAVAKLLGCPADETVITRNTTESLDLVISGYDWKPGDEAVMAEQDYPAMLNMFKQVSARHGMVNKIVSVPLHPASDEEIVELYANAITDRTRLLMICHMINITGHILPVRKICDMAHSRGVEVMVDGAHAVAHFRFTLPDLDCDYYGSSLHKWLSAPLGAGMLWVRKDLIGKVWPLIGPAEKAMDDITRLNHIGTHPVHTDLAILDSIEFYQKVGAQRKEERLRFLMNYWTSRVREVPRVILNTPSDPARSCGIANVGIRGMKPNDLGDALLKQYGIYTAPIDGAGVHGCRITPNIYTTPSELDVLVWALKELGS